MEKTKSELAREAVDKSLQTVSKGVKCPFTGCNGIINAIDAVAQIRWYRLDKPDYGLPTGSWTIFIRESKRYTLTCSLNGDHQTTLKYDELPEDFRRFTYFGVKPYTPSLKRKVH